PAEVARGAGAAARAVAAARGVLDAAVADPRAGGGIGAGILIAETVADAFVVEFDLEFVAAERVGAAGDLIENLPRADVTVRDRDGALEVIVGERDGGGSGAKVDRAGSVERRQEQDGSERSHDCLTL